MTAALLRDFLVLLDEEARVLITGDVDDIEQIAARKESLFAELQSSESADGLDEDELALAERCRMRNLSNGRLIARLRTSAAEQLSILTGHSGVDERYGQAGKPLQGERTRPLTSV